MNIQDNGETMIKNIFIYDLVLCKEIETSYGYKNKVLNIKDLIFSLDKNDFIKLMDYLYYFDEDIPVFAISHNNTSFPWSKIEIYIESKYNLFFIDSDDIFN